MQQTILVTGGLGYIGSHTIVELLDKNYKVVCIDNLSNSQLVVKDWIKEITNKDFDYFNIDICDLVAIQNCLKNYESIAAVIHFAAYKAVNESVENPIKYYQNNLQGLISLIEAVKPFNSHIIFSSSCTVYGEPEYSPITEQAIIVKPKSPYGNTKKICEEILFDNASVSSNKTTILRYFNPVGAHVSGKIGELPLGTPQNLLPFLTQTAIGKRSSLTIFGKNYPTPDGTCIRDFIHVSDLALAHVASIDYMFESDTEKYSVFNIGTGKGTSVLEMVQRFEELTNVKLHYQFGENRAGDIVKIWASATKAAKFLKWKAKFGLDEILLSAWKWECNFREKEL